MPRKATIFFTLFLILVFSNTAYAAKLAVKSAAVMDYSSGKILFEQAPYKKIPPASITKIMTMYLVWEALEKGRIKMSDKVKVSVRADKTGGSTMNLKAGEKVTIRELMDGMAVASGNDACIAIAEHFGGAPKFVGMMNRKARELGMIDTVFINPNGLPAKGQVTTARDMLKLAQSYIKRFPQALDIHSKRSITHNGRTRKNSNRLLGKYKGVDGIKTGWVNASGYNIVATAKRGDTRLIAVVLGGKTWKVRNLETRKALDLCFKETSGSTLAEARIKQAPASSFKGKAARQPSPKTRPAVAKAARRTSKTAQNVKPSPSANPVQIAPTDALSPTREASASSHALQESSWKNIGEARKRAGLLQKKGVPAHIVSVDLGDKGVWHRVMIGSFDNRKEAEQYKKTLAKRFDLAHAIIR